MCRCQGRMQGMFWSFWKPPLSVTDLSAQFLHAPCTHAYRACHTHTLSLGTPFEKSCEHPWVQCGIPQHMCQAHGIATSHHDNLRLWGYETYKVKDIHFLPVIQNTQWQNHHCCITYPPLLPSQLCIQHTLKRENGLLLDPAPLSPIDAHNIYLDHTQ